MLTEILETIKDGKPHLFTNNLREIFSWKGLEFLLNLRPFVNSSRMLTINNNPYTWEYQAWMTDNNSFPPSLLDDVIKQNLCLLIDCSRVNEKINDICKQLETHFDGLADAHILFTLNENNTQGNNIHWDQSHNLILQVEGESSLKVWDICSTNDQFKESLDSPPVIDVTLNVGDCVFVPKNYYYHHKISKKSVSISFPILFDQESIKQDRHWIKL